MPDAQSIFEEIRPRVATLSPEERLWLIQNIATIHLERPRTNVKGQRTESLARQQQLATEQSRWFARPLAERRQYGSSYVALHQGEVVDHDVDQRALYLRIRQQYGHIPVLIIPANVTETPEFTIHSPRLTK